MGNYNTTSERSECSQNMAPRQNPMRECSSSMPSRQMQPRMAMEQSCQRNMERSAPCRRRNMENSSSCGRQNMENSAPCGRQNMGNSAPYGRQSMGNSAPYERQSMENSTLCGHNTEMKDPISNMPIAMAYVPWQFFRETYEPDKALQYGTIFPELNKPFYGKGGCLR